jgi:Ca2+-transporting ATPase
MPPRRASKSSSKRASTPWTDDVEQVASAFGLDLARGLGAKQVSAARAVHGFNELDKEDGKPLWKLVLEQFDDALVKILLLAAVVSFALAFTEERAPGVDVSLVDFVEPGVILLILVLNAIVGVWQESNAENALEALKEMQSETARCLRDGAWRHDLPARELVPGDVIEIRTGDRVPADARVVELRTATVRLDQASLTGESVSVGKIVEPVSDPDCELQAKECVVFGGTAVTQGQCRAVVIATGMRTEMGKIQEQIQRASEETEDTPLKQKLDDFGDQLTWAIGIICLLVWVMNYQFFISWSWSPAAPFAIRDVAFDFSQCTYYFKIAVALAVAAIPEGLPAVITTCLALGTRKMAKKNAIVRKLQSVETLGCTSVICSDKTGTLTTNQMSATRVVVPGATAAGKFRAFDVLGSSYDPSDGGVVGLKKLDASLATLAKICASCNDAVVESAGDGGFKCSGEPTEGALKVLAEKLGVENDAEMSRIVELRRASPESSCAAVSDAIARDAHRLAVLEFDRGRKSMSVVVRTSNATFSAGASKTVRGTKKTKAAAGSKGTNALLVKGAPENVLERCAKIQMPDGSVAPLSPAAKKQIVDQTTAMSKTALRVLGFAVKSGSDLGVLETYDGSVGHPGHALLKDPSSYEAIESELTFVGLAGLRDPPRPEVAGAVAECASAGIRVVVITGDNKLTAEAICLDIGIFQKPSDSKNRSFTGREFASLPKKKQIALLQSPGGVVCSRAEPKHKQDIVRLLKEQGEIVAMTGDGVNDAPALKLADIGIAMGITGTAVAKEASDMVLADDNFSSIVDAVSEGRSIYNNMKAFIRYMISSNVGEVVSIFLTAALGMPEGLIPVQLLWVNLVTDGPPATALGFNPPDVDIMTKRPRRKDEDLISRWAMVRYLVVGLYVGAATVGVFAVWYTRTSFLGLDFGKDGHTVVTWKQLSRWSECATWPAKEFSGGSFVAGGVEYSFRGAEKCDYFTEGKLKASTLSLTVLVVIEMFNACNAISEDISLFVMPPWINPWLLLAMFSSFALHFLILYVPALARIFSIVPLDASEWALVLLFSTPVWLIDEALKFYGRNVVMHGK